MIYKYRRTSGCFYTLNIPVTNTGYLFVKYANLVFLSVQNVIDRKPYPEDPDLVEVKFATTPIMSTYLVAFVIGEYDFVESQSSDGVTVRVYTPVGKAEQGKFALEVLELYIRVDLRHDDLLLYRHQNCLVIYRLNGKQTNPHLHVI